MKLIIKLTVLIAASIMAIPVYAKDGPDILQIFDAFVLSSAAASKCEKPDKETLDNFLVHFLTISGYARQELKHRFPKNNDAQIDNAMKQKIDYLTKKVDEVISQRGCTDYKIKELIKKFYFHSKWDPFGK